MTGGTAFRQLFIPEESGEADREGERQIVWLSVLVLLRCCRAAVGEGANKLGAECTRCRRWLVSRGEFRGEETSM